MKGKTQQAAAAASDLSERSVRNWASLQVRRISGGACWTLSKLDCRIASQAHSLKSLISEVCGTYPDFPKGSWLFICAPNRLVGDMPPSGLRLTP